METMESHVKTFLKKYPSTYPPTLIYIDCLILAKNKFNITKEEAMNRYGVYDGEQWYKLLFEEV